MGQDGSIAEADVWSDEAWLGARAQFRPEAFPALLRVHDVAAADAGMYRCRVDFNEAPTRNTLINLTVIGKEHVCLDALSRHRHQYVYRVAVKMVRSN